MPSFYWFEKTLNHAILAHRLSYNAPHFAALFENSAAQCWEVFRSVP